MLLASAAAAAAGRNNHGAPMPASERLALRETVREMFSHGYENYMRHAFPHDELKPVSRGRTDWVGLGLTIIDSLDSLYLAGLNAELEHALSWVRKSHKSHTPHVATSHPARHSRVCAPPSLDSDPTRHTPHRRIVNGHSHACDRCALRSTSTR